MCHILVNFARNIKSYVSCRAFCYCTLNIYQLISNISDQAYLERFRCLAGHTVCVLALVPDQADLTLPLVGRRLELGQQAVSLHR